MDFVRHYSQWQKPALSQILAGRFCTAYSVVGYGAGIRWDRVCIMDTAWAWEVSLVDFVVGALLDH